MVTIRVRCVVLASQARSDTASLWALALDVMWTGDLESVDEETVLYVG